MSVNSHDDDVGTSIVNIQIPTRPLPLLFKRLRLRDGNIVGVTKLESSTRTTLG